MTSAHGGHAGHLPTGDRKALILSGLLTGVYFVAELVLGFWSGSVSVLSDAFHNFERTLSCFLDLVEAAKHYPALKKEWVEFLGAHPSDAIDRVETVSVHTA